MLDLTLLGRKLFGCRSRLEYSLYEVEESTGIQQNRLLDFEKGLLEPTGDEILILADFFKEDYKFFISNQITSASENTETLYRQFGNDFFKEDRRRIQEFLYLCECEADVWELLDKKKREFQTPKNNIRSFDEIERIAGTVRSFLGYRDNDLMDNIFDDFRKTGIHIFRRELLNSNISGLFIKHPVAGKCILINYSEDLYRQNFTLSHEVAHSIFDSDAKYNVSFKNDGNDFKEIRANRFAAAFLMPDSSLRRFNVTIWSKQIMLRLAEQFRVSITALLIRLKTLRLIETSDYEIYKNLKLPHALKEDPELKGLSDKIKSAKSEILKRGLSSSYIRECHEVYANSTISQSRLAEMLLISEEELSDLLGLFNLKLTYEF